MKVTSIEILTNTTKSNKSKKILMEVQGKKKMVTIKKMNLA